MPEDNKYGYFNVAKIGSPVKAVNSVNRQSRTVQASSVTNGAIDMDQVAWSSGANPFDDAVAYVTPNLFFVDGSDALANNGLTIQFEYLSTGAYTTFKAFITAFNENFNCDWSEEPVFGRADPLMMFKQTSRTMTLSFVVPAASQAEGFENMGRLQALLSFLYPAYSDVDNSLSISQSPLVRMKVMNLTSKNVGTYQDHIQGFEQGEGLLGAITNLSVNHNIDNPEFGVFVTSKGTIIPKMFEVTLDFKVIHEQHLGWDAAKANELGPAGLADRSAYFSDPSFPYGANIAGSQPRNAQEQAEFIDQEAQSYTQAIIDERVAAEREAGLQAAMDTAKAKLLKKDGTLKKRADRWRRRIGETNDAARGHGDAFEFAIKDKQKASEMAAAVYAADVMSGNEPKESRETSANNIAVASGIAGESAENVRQQRWSFIR